MANLATALSISPSRSPLASPPRFKRAAAAAPFRCWSGPSPQVESGAPKKPVGKEEKASSSASVWGIPTSSWSAGLGALGFVETGYLTYLKFTNSEAFCPAGGGSCGDVLNSEYSNVFGVPLPLIGMAAYGLVALLSVPQIRKNLLSVLDETDARLILLATTTSMATASSYFLYLLSTSLAGTSCAYCLVSAFLSFSLFFITLKDLGVEEIRKALGLQFAIVAIVVTALSNSYTMVTPQMSGSGDITLEPYKTEIKNHSTPFAIALAKYLHSIGAKMYGAFWCSHCLEQKEMFGREAAKILDYVECFPDGAGKGKTMAFECSLLNLKGFPTWVINDKVVSGEKELTALAEVSGFVYEDSLPSKP